MEARPVYCKTFVLNNEAWPDLEDLIRAADPEQMEQMYRAAGMEMLAKNAEPLRRAAVAAQQYQELPTDDYALYANFLTRAVKLKNCVIPPPDEAVSVLVAAQKAKLFGNTIMVLTHPTSGECLVLGQIQAGNAVRYFKLAHWGHTLTSVEQLRKQQRLSRVVGSRARNAFKPQSKGSSRRGFRASIYFGAITILAALPCWTLLLPINWWLFAGVLVGVMVLCGYYVAKRSSYNLAQRWTVGLLVAANILAAIGTGVAYAVRWENANRTEDILVCAVRKPGLFDNRWTIDTSAGTRNLQGGFYNGTYYPTGSETAARSLVGKWVRVTEHGHDSSDEDSMGPTVTGAKTLRAGSCG